VFWSVVDFRCINMEEKMRTANAGDALLVSKYEQTDSINSLDWPNVTMWGYYDSQLYNEVDGTHRLFWNAGS
jgi:hypothetical protein